MTQPKDENFELEWRPVRPFPNFEVSNTGLVRKRFNGKVLEPCGHNDSMVKLTDSKGRSIERQIRGLVVGAFGHAPIAAEVEVPPEKDRAKKKREGIRLIEVPPNTADDSVIEDTDPAIPKSPAESGSGYDDDERWGKHLKYPDYEISTRGRIRALPIGRRPQAYYVTLQQRGKPETAHVFAYFRTGPSMQDSRRVDEVVLETFEGAAPGPEYGPRHLDGVLANCALSNLGWAQGYAVTKTTKKYKGRKPVPNRRPKVTPELVEEELAAVPTPNLVPESPASPQPEDDDIEMAMVLTARNGMSVTIAEDGHIGLPRDIDLAALDRESASTLSRLLAKALT